MLARVCCGCHDMHNNPTASAAFRTSTLEELERNHRLLAKGGLERTSSGGIFRESDARAAQAEASSALAASCPHALRHIHVIRWVYEKPSKKYSWEFQVRPEFCETQTLQKRFSAVKAFHAQLLSELREKQVGSEYQFKGKLPVEPWSPTVNEAFLRRRQDEFVAYWKDFVQWEKNSRSHALGLGGGASGVVMSLKSVEEFFETANWVVAKRS